MADLTVRQVMQKLGKDILNWVKTNCVDNLVSTSKNLPLSANQGRVLKEGQDAINQSLDDLSDVKIHRYYSNDEKYVDFYYDTGSCYLGLIYNLGSNAISDIRPTLFTLRVSYDGSAIQYDQLTDSPNATINITKAANNKYVTLSVTYNALKNDLTYLVLWMCRIA